MVWIQVRDGRISEYTSLWLTMRPGIIATTLGHDSFKYYMLGPKGINAPLTGMSNISSLPG
jgi:hypothetical protein